jgi:hypothetical protein
MSNGSLIVDAAGAVSMDIERHLELFARQSSFNSLATSALRSHSESLQIRKVSGLGGQCCYISQDLSRVASNTTVDAPLTSLFSQFPLYRSFTP